MPIMALGKPGEVSGVGRLLIDEESWRVKVAELMRRSSLIFCIPSDHPGTKWELDEIVSKGYLSKVIFLMPPEPTFIRKWKPLRDDWTLAVVHLRTYGFEIPDYRTPGLLFTIRRNVGCFIETLDLTSPAALTNSILRLAEPVPPSRRWPSETVKRSAFARLVASAKRRASSWWSFTT